MDAMQWGLLMPIDNIKSVYPLFSLLKGDEGGEIDKVRLKQLR